LYIGNNLEGESSPVYWWSYDVPEGGKGRVEAAYENVTLAWGDGVRATAEPDGRVVLSTSGEERLLAKDRPEGCEPPSDSLLAAMPVFMALAGDRPVVTYWCGDSLHPVTVVYDLHGAAVQVDGAALQTADEGLVMLTPPGGGAHGKGDPGGIFLLELDDLTITRIGSEIHDAQVDLAGGLVLWNTPGPLDSRQIYDVVWRVAHVPGDG
jgi:hypothetical protein